MGGAAPTVAVLGASGLIGGAIAAGLADRGLPVVAVARRFPAALDAELGARAVATPVAELSVNGVARLLAGTGADVVVNAIGVLQDGPGGRTGAVHVDFVGRLTAAIATLGRPVLLVHLAGPGAAEDDATGFSRSKRAAEAVIAAAAGPYLILRPGFVVAPAAYGGGALVRALAALPQAHAEEEAGRPIAAAVIGGIVAAGAFATARWQAGERHFAATFDIMERDAGSVGDVIAAFRRRLGGPRPALTLPGWLLALGARAADLASRLGWQSPMRSTALAELRRGAAGDPRPWIAAPGIEPAPLSTLVARLPATVQEAWFARLYLLKALVIAVLAAFWIASGTIALTLAFDEATAILSARGLAEPAARAITVASSLVDIAVGMAIAFRRTARTGLIAGIAVALGYMAGAAVLTPDLWAEPLGALVKTGPAIVLMLVALAIDRSR